MRQNKGLLIIIGIVLVAVVTGVLAMSGDKQPESKTTASDSNTGISKSETEQASDTSVAVNEVNISNFAYSPRVITIKVGTTVTWTNKDSIQHDISPDEASADAPKGPLLAQGESYSFTFKKAGTYDYHCTPHPQMHGRVIVTD